MKRTTAIAAVMAPAFSSLIFTFDYAVGQRREPSRSRAKDEQAIQKIVDDNPATRNSHDMKASAKLFTDDADCVVISCKHMGEAKRQMVDRRLPQYVADQNWSGCSAPSSDPK